ncbi:MAG: tetratricopeptide repeat protein [Planctomycetia bacterium]|nr:tetratricopeptide repeat protein [Planctomycetia bacterium]
MAENVRVSRLEEYYRQYLDDQDAPAFIRRVGGTYMVGTLGRLVRADRAEVRRAATLALGLVGMYDCNAVLGRALHDADRSVRIAAENGIRAVWCRDGGDDEQQSLRTVIRLNGAAHFSEAIEQASELIERAAWFAEAWNQRAIANYSLGNYDQAIADCHEALEINPYHFGAAAGMGQCHLQLGDTAKALDCFRRALRLNPNLEGVRANIAQIERSRNAD